MPKSITFVRPVLRHDDVGRLQVEMDDPVLVRIDQRGPDIPHDLEGLRLRHSLEVFRADDAVERLSGRYSIVM